MTNTQRISLAVTACLGAAWVALHLGAPVCRIVVIDDAGQRWVAGAGSDLAGAWQGANVPENWREITFPGCYAHR